VSFFFFPVSAFAQTDKAPETVRVAPGPEYTAGSTHRFFYGDLWRNLWTEIVDVELLDLDHFAGGLTVVGGGPPLPEHRSGRCDDTVVRSESEDAVAVGWTARSAGSLYLKGANNQLYSFRLLDGRPEEVLPSNVQTLFASHVRKDLVAATHPYGELVANTLRSAVGIRSPDVQIVVLPESDRLGEMKGIFSGRPGILFTSPDQSWEEGIPAEEFSSDATVSTCSTTQLLCTLDRDHRQRVDAVEYLKARIMDLYLGDWARSEDGWRWLPRKNVPAPSGEWIPVSLSPTHDFTSFDGFFPWVGSFVVPQVGAFGSAYASIATQAWSSRNLDRRLLSPLGRQTWDSVTGVIISRLTDSVIAGAVARIPTSARSRGGDALEATLRARRAALSQAAGDFYRLLASTVDVRGSDRRECAEVMRSDGTHVEVNLFAVDAAGSPQRDAPLYHRIFSSEETDEIRLSLLGGDDRVILRGTVDSSIPVYVVGGDGDDQIIDSSRVNGYLFGVVPFVHAAETATYVYDSNSRAVKEGSSTAMDFGGYASPTVSTQYIAPSPDDRGSAWKVGVMFDWNSQLGMIAGIGPIYYRYGFRKDPYAYKLSLVGGYSPYANVGRVVFTADSRMVLDNASVSVEALASGYETLTYYGSGNETHPALDPNDKYYRVHQQLFRIEPALQYPASGSFAATVRAGVRYVRTDSDLSSYVRDVRAYGVENMTLATLGAGLRWDSRDLEPHPYKGLYVDIGGTYVPKAFTAGKAFGKARGDLRLFFSPVEASDLTLSVRLVGEKTWGKVPYFEAASIGSSTLLRGFQQKRFVGDAALAGVFEARVKVGELDIVFPTTIGVFGFVETGRVFVAGEDSRMWHPSYGAGVWAAPWNRETTLTGSLGFSEESVLLYGSIGFSF